MELIEREALKICKHGNGYGYCFLHEEYCPEGPCEKEELIEYAPVAHGRWVDSGEALRHCSECGAYYFPYDYCPNCGARMMNGGERHEAD